MTAILVDTDVLVDVLRGRRRVRWTAADDPAISVVTRAELFAGRSARPDDLRAFLAPFLEHPVTAPVAEVAGTLRRTAGIALADALIAATALATGRALMTRNDRHFRAIEDLTVIHPDRR